MKQDNLNNLGELLTKDDSELLANFRRGEMAEQDFYDFMELVRELHEKA